MAIWEGLLSYSPDAVVQKYAGNNRAGMSALLAGGALPAYPDRSTFPSTWKDDLTAHGIMKRASEESLSELVERIAEVAKASDVQLWLGGKDYPFHVSMLTAETTHGPLKDLTFDERKPFLDTVAHDPEMLEILDGFRRVHVTFDWLGIGPAGITLHATRIPLGIAEQRKRLAEIYTKYELVWRPMENILHTSLVRPKSLPTENRKEKLQQYVCALAVLAQEVAAFPLTLTPERLILIRDIMNKGRADI